VFPLIGAVYFWFPKATGRLMSERVGWLSFALVFVGSHLTFFPMHLLGFHGMPRRVYTYLPDSGWTGLNQLASVGAVLIATSVLLFLINVIRALRRPADAPGNPWGAGGLEWFTASPPPSCNFEYTPVVPGRYALWSERAPGVVTGLKREKREVLVTHVLDASPDHKMESAKPSIWTLWAALATTALFISSIFTPWGVVYGAIPVFITLVGWFWPKKGDE